MRKNKKWWITILFCIGVKSLFAQESATEELEKLLENIFANQYDEEVDVEQLYENLIQFYQEPLNINSASANDLRKFFFLSERQISNIIHYREYYGSLLSEYELAVIPDMDQKSIESLLPFIQISPLHDRRVLLHKRLQGANNRYLILRQSTILERKKGYLQADSLLEVGGPNLYDGSPHQLYTRLRITQPGSISLGFTMEKDAGEENRWDHKTHKYGADFVSAHFQLEKAGPFEQLTVGDLNFQSGQQLVFGGGLGLGKGAMTVRSVGRSQFGVKPYTSSTESGFMRGGSATWKIPLSKQHIFLTALYSSNYQHAKLHHDTSERIYFRSFDLSGLHRNSNEIMDRNTVQVKSTGANLHFMNRYQNLQAGVNVLHSSYSVPLIPATSLYKTHDFRGTHHQMGSIYYAYQHQHWYSFAELAYASNKQYGIIAGVSGSLNSYMESVWLYRNYSTGFYSPYGNAFGESTRNANEEGLYWGLRLEPIAKLTLGAYYDMFRFPWLRYRVDAPSRGYEYLMRASYQLNRSTLLNLQYREESKGINVGIDSLAFKSVREGVRRNLIFMLDHDINENVGLKTRIHSSSYAIEDSLTKGWVVAQDVSYTRGRWKADARFALINTDDYNNRQYLYENDLLYTFSVPAYAGRGIRSYLLLRYKVNRYLSSWVRLGRTMYDDRDVIGSGLEKIQTNHRTQIRTQVILKF